MLRENIGHTFTLTIKGRFTCKRLSITNICGLFKNSIVFCSFYLSKSYYFTISISKYLRYFCFLYRS